MKIQGQVCLNLFWVLRLQAHGAVLARECKSSRPLFASSFAAPTDRANSRGLCCRCKTHHWKECCACGRDLKRRPSKIFDLHVGVVHVKHCHVSPRGDCICRVQQPFGI